MSKQKYHVWIDIENDKFFPVFAEDYWLDDGFFWFGDTAVRADIVERIEWVATGYEHGDIAKEMREDPRWRNRGQTEG